ncbi:MAG: ARMT1-like domain-containing protein [Thermodesulfobacteriota bacterium]
MRSALECIPCLLKQTLFTARLATSDESCQAKIMARVAQLLADMDLEQTPPENSMAVYETISALSGCPDPYVKLKEESNQLAARFSEEARTSLAQSAAPLETALHLAIAGNIIDYGSKQDFDAQAELQRALARPLAMDDSLELAQAFDQARTVLYLTDNAGEIVFDKLVIEALTALGPGKKIVAAVKSGPIINDALAADARAVGLDQICTVVTNGTSCPGTPLSRCSAEFQEIFAKADLIISKGQGNFETLSETPGPIFFLLTIKCPIVAAHIDQISGRKASLGDMVLFQRP